MWETRLHVSDRRSFIGNLFLSPQSQRTLFILFSGWDLAPRGNGCVVENSVLILWHMNATCDAAGGKNCTKISLSRDYDVWILPIRWPTAWALGYSVPVHTCGSIKHGRWMCSRRPVWAPLQFPAPGGCGQRLGWALCLATASIRRLIHVRSAVWSKHLLNL